MPNVDIDSNGVIDIVYGGTNASTAEGARTNLGLGSASTLDADEVATSVNGQTGDVVLDPDDLDDSTTTNKFNVQSDWDASSGLGEILNKPTLGTAAALDVGTDAGDIVQLNGSGQLPAVDGSLLTGISGESGAVDSVNGQTGVVVLDPDDLDDTSTTNKFNVQSDWNASSGLEQILNKPTLGTSSSLDVGTDANEVVQLNGSSQLPAVDGSLLTNLPTATINLVASDPVSPSTGDVWVRTDTYQMCVKTSGGIIRYEAFSYEAD